MSESPWYKDGLKFKCTGCGQCCTGGPGFVWVPEDEMKEMAKHLNISVSQFKCMYTRQRDNKFALIEKKSENNACIFLKENRCQIYQARPLQCRTFPWWKENLQSKQAWEAAAASCEGINDEAPLITIDQIKKHVDQT